MARSKDALLRLHSRLLARRDALRKALDGDLNSLHALSAMTVGDDVDAASDAANEEINSQLVEIESRELEQIEHALRRIEIGVYGRCEFCGGKIAEARINALPYATSCIDCQRENERYGRTRRRASDDPRWGKLYDREARDRDPEIRIRDFELDISEAAR